MKNIIKKSILSLGLIVAAHSAQAASVTKNQSAPFTSTTVSSQTAPAPTGTTLQNIVSASSGALTAATFGAQDSPDFDISVVNDPVLAAEWNGAVLWNGFSEELDYSCDASSRYNQRWASLAAGLISIADGDSQSEIELGASDGDGNMAGIAMQGVQGVATTRGTPQHVYESYYTGVAANKDYMRFVNNLYVSLSKNADGLSQESVTVELSDYGMTRRFLRGKSVRVFVTALAANDLEDVTQSNGNSTDGYGLLHYYVDEVAYDFTSASSVEVTFEAENGTDASERGDHDVLFYSMMVYDPEFVEVSSGFTAAGLSSGGAVDETVVLNGENLPESFDASAVDENMPMFIGVTGFAWAGMDKENHALSFNVQLESFEKSSSDQGVATFEISGRRHRDNCGLVTEDSDAPIVSMQIVSCRSATVCGAAYQEQSETSAISYPDYFHDVIYIDGLGI